MLSAIGNQTLRMLEYVGGVSRQTREGFYWTFVAPFRGGRLRWRSAVHQAAMAGVNALPVVCLIAFFIGLIMALQGAYEMRKFGALHLVVDLVGVSITRELGPLMTAIIVIGRSGSSRPLAACSQAAYAFMSFSSRRWRLATATATAIA